MKKCPLIWIGLSGHGRIRVCAEKMNAEIIHPVDGDAERIEAKISRSPQADTLWE